MPKCFEALSSVHNLEKGERVRKKLLEDPVIQKTNPSASIEIFELNPSRYNSVLSFSKNFDTNIWSLDSIETYKFAA